MDVRFQRANRLLQLDDVLMQEEMYLKLLVAQISALGPDLLIIGKNVSRLAQEFLLEAGNTPRSIMRMNEHDRYRLHLEREGEGEMKRESSDE